MTDQQAGAGGQGLPPQCRCKQACPALIPCCLRGGGPSRRHLQAGATGWGQGRGLRPPGHKVARPWGDGGKRAAHLAEVLTDPQHYRARREGASGEGRGDLQLSGSAQKNRSHPA